MPVAEKDLNKIVLVFLGSPVCLKKEDMKVSLGS